MDKVKILVCGGRDYHNQGLVNIVLSVMWSWRPFDILIHGDARGADTLARKWADQNSVNHQPYPADWHQYGKAAGKIRNREMIREQPEIVLAFPGGGGTQDMINVAQETGIPVFDLRHVANHPGVDDDIPF